MPDKLVPLRAHPDVTVTYTITDDGQKRDMLVTICHEGEAITMPWKAAYAMMARLNELHESGLNTWDFM